MTTEQTAEALVEHEGFVRALARSLVSDRWLADDLAQDTWVAALRHPPASDDSPRGWLARVLRNQLHNLRRGNARREARESAVAGIALEDRSETLHGRLSLQHLVVEAVLALPSLYRDVVLLHFYEGLSAAEIARRRHVPPATVRSQLKRGLDQIRERLDREQTGGRAAWCALLLALEREVPQVPPTAAGLGAGVVLGMCALVLGVVAFCVLDPIGFLDQPGMGAGSLPFTPAPQLSDSAEPIPRGGVAMGDPLLIDREPIPLAPERVTVVCKDTSGRPLPKVEVWVLQNTKQPDGKCLFREFGPYASNASGRVVGPIAVTCRDHQHYRLVYARVPGELVGWRLVGSPREARLEETGDRLPPIEVTLTPSRTVSGTVSVPEGFDLASVNVRVHSIRTPDERRTGGSFPRNRSFPGLESVLPEQLESRVDREGRFEFRDVPVGGMLYLMAEAPGLGQAQYANVGHGPVPIAELVELVMWPEGLVAGVVTDPGGVPVVGASVSVRPHGGAGIYVTAPFEASTDVHGAFRVDGLPANEFDVYVDVPRRDVVFRPKTIHLARGQGLDLDLELESSVRVAGTVVDATTGKGIEGVGVTAIEPHEYGLAPVLGYANSDAAGAFELRLPRGHVAIYFGGIPRQYAHPDPQIVKTFVIGEDRLPVEGLRFTLQPIGDK